MFDSNKLHIFIAALLAVFIFTSSAYADDLSGKKVLYIDSYHYEYPWSKVLTNTIFEVMERNGVELKTLHMDTKNNQEEDFKKQAALKAKKVIEEYKPDVVIATDDNAAKYLIAPYYIDSDIPFIFAGINWDASQYGFPTKNVTGMLEVSTVDELLEVISSFYPVEKVAFLATESFTVRKELKYIKAQQGIDFAYEEITSSYDEWKEKYIELQDKVDVIFMDSMLNVEGFDKADAIAFIKDNTKIITCSTVEFLKDYAAIVYARLASEQAEWPANAAIDVLKGKAVADIPMTRNKEGKIYINSKIVNKLGVSVPVELMEVSEIIE